MFFVGVDGDGGGVCGREGAEVVMVVVVLTEVGVVVLVES